ncbi:MAG: hypothetical protein II879_10115 [Clostridia bacterium]|nr:hypothetical protein [Clostridia bacterium]
MYRESVTADVVFTFEIRVESMDRISAQIIHGQFNRNIAGAQLTNDRMHSSASYDVIPNSCDFISGRIEIQPPTYSASQIMFDEVSRLNDKLARSMVYSEGFCYTFVVSVSIIGNKIHILTIIIWDSKRSGGAGERNHLFDYSHRRIMCPYFYSCRSKVFASELYLLCLVGVKREREDTELTNGHIVDLEGVFHTIHVVVFCPRRPAPDRRDQHRKGHHDPQFPFHFFSPFTPKTQNDAETPRQKKTLTNVKGRTIRAGWTEHR